MSVRVADESTWTRIRHECSSIPTNKYRQEAIFALLLALYECGASPDWPALLGRLVCRVVPLLELRAALCDNRFRQEQTLRWERAEHHAAKAFWTEARLECVRRQPLREPRDLIDIVERCLRLDAETYAQAMALDELPHPGLASKDVLLKEYMPAAIAPTDEELQRLFPHRYTTERDDETKGYVRGLLDQVSDELHPMDRACLERLPCGTWELLEAIHPSIASCQRALREALKMCVCVIVDGFECTTTIKNFKHAIEVIRRRTKLSAIRFNRDRACSERVYELVEQWKQEALAGGRRPKTSNA